MTQHTHTHIHTGFKHFGSNQSHWYLLCLGYRQTGSGGALALGKGLLEVSATEVLSQIDLKLGHHVKRDCFPNTDDSIDGSAN